MRCFVIILGRVTDAKYRRILGSSFQERMARCSKDDRLLIEEMMMREFKLMMMIEVEEKEEEEKEKEEDKEIL